MKSGIMLQLSLLLLATTLTAAAGLLLLTSGGIPLAIGGGGVLLAALGGGVWGVRGLLRPLAEIASHIRENDRHGSIPPFAADNLAALQAALELRRQEWQRQEANHLTIRQELEEIAAGHAMAQKEERELRKQREEELIQLREQISGADAAANEAADQARQELARVREELAQKERELQRAREAAFRSETGLARQREREREELAQKEQALQRAQEATARAENELLRQQQQAQEALAQKEQALRQSKEATARAENELTRQREREQEALAQKEQALQRAREAIARMETELARQREREREEAHRLAAVQEQLETLESTLAQALAAHAQDEEDLTRERHESAALHQQVEELSQQRKQLSEEVERNTREREQLSSNLEHRNQELVALTEELDQHKAQAREGTRQREALQRQVRELGQDRRQAQERLVRLEQRLVQLEWQVTNTPQPHLWVNRDGIIQAANPAATTFLDAPRPLGASLADLAPEALDADPASCLEENRPATFTTTINARTQRFTVLPDRQSDGCLVVGVDITPLRALEGTLADREALLDQLTRHMSEGVYVLDAEGRITLLNPLAEQLLKWSPEELRGKPVHDFIHFQDPQGEYVPSADCPVLRMIRSGEVYRVEEDVFTRRDGHLIPVSFVSAPIRAGGRLLGSVTVFQETSLRKQMEREVQQARDVALEASRLKSDFMANMSHEIRTPINGIVGMNQLLLETKLNKEQKELATTVRDSAQALLTIVNDILDFAKIETGKLEMVTGPLHPLPLVEEVAELLAPQAYKKSLDLLVDVDAKVPDTLLGDAGSLRQVLMNLVGNGIKFTKKGEVVIRTRLEEKSPTHATLRFVIKDSGIGMTKAVRDNLFRPFTQADSSASRLHGGTGLGLSIAKRLVEMMGGKIGTESRKGKGSTFWFTVPLELPKAQEAPAPRLVAPAHLRDMKVLVVDRNITSQTIILNHLFSWHMRGTAVESVEEAMATLHHQRAAGSPCDMVIVDRGSNLEEKLTFASQVRQDPQLATTRLLLMTPNATPEELRQAQEAGFAGFIGKPLQRGRLLHSLVEMVTLTENQRPPFSSPPAPAPAPASALEEARTDRLILLAEDNVVNQKVAQMQLNRMGYAVQVVANGREAVNALANHPYALVLMDCQMPVMDGYSATRAIRQQETGNGRRIPIIAMTANAMRGDREKCLACGMDDYLSKPVQTDELAIKLQQWLPLAGATPVSGEVEKAEETARSGTPIDISRLEEYFSGDRETVREFLKLYHASVERGLESLKRGIKLKEAETVRATANELHGASLNVGAGTMTTLAGQLESAAGEAAWGPCRSLMDEIQKQFKAIEQQVKKYG